MKSDLDLEHLDRAQAGSELSDADLEGIVGGKGGPFAVSVGGYGGGWGGGWGGYGGYGGWGGYRGFGGWGGYRGWGGYGGFRRGYGRRWW